MKLLSRDFTRGEKALLLVLCLILVGLLYYNLIDRPVRTSLESARAEKEALQVELIAVDTKIAQLEKMAEELESITSDPNVSYMGSYNNSKEELTFLNDLLDETENYSIDFSGVTRDGDQIRRNFTLKYTVRDFTTMEDLMKQLTESDLRCLIDNVSYSTRKIYYNTNERVNRTAEYYTRVDVTATATFYETMVGGTPDAGLPDSGRAA